MAENTEKKVLIVAGEASGDLHASHLVHEVKRHAPKVKFFGIGGPHMRKAGVETLVDSADMAVVGLVEVLIHFRTVYSALLLMRKQLREQKPDLLILVDYPDFNLRLAKTAKALGIKVLYYISPQVWAWRQGRVHMIGQRIDMMAVVFPFEVPFYEKANVPVRFVGHPLTDEVCSDLSREEALKAFSLEPSRQTVGLFPGSRHSEIKRLLPVLLETAEKLNKTQPHLQFILSRASSLSEDDLAPYLENNTLNIKVVADRPYDVMRACDAIATASGTATLEIAIMGIPLVVIYKVSPLTYGIMQHLIKIKDIALCNIVAGERVVPELIQNDATAGNISMEIRRFLEDQTALIEMREKLNGIEKKLNSSKRSTSIGKLALEMLGL